MQRIRDMYGVPAKRGGRVRYSGPFGTREGTITGSTSTQMYLRIRLDGERLSCPSTQRGAWSICQAGLVTGDPLPNPQVGSDMEAVPLAWPERRVAWPGHGVEFLERRRLGCYG
jgi:hypothetical protein